MRKPKKTSFCLIKNKFLPREVQQLEKEVVDDTSVIETDGVGSVFVAVGKDKGSSSFRPSASSEDPSE